MMNRFAGFFINFFEKTIVKALNTAYFNFQILTF